MMKFRALPLFSAVLAVSWSGLAPPPAHAQFGGLFKSKSKAEPKAEETATDCDAKSEKSVGRSILGGMLGDLTGRATRGMGVPGSWVPSDEVAGILTDAIACQLDPDEQKQAADATLEATRGEEIGSTASWESGTREDVSGSSTVTSKTASADGTTCMTVTDVVIVEGEETTVNKKMCRAQGETRYTVLV